MRSDQDYTFNTNSSGLWKSILCLTLVYCLLAVFFCPEQLAAEKLNQQVNSTLKQLPKWVQPPDFEYTPQDNPDPFQRFLEIGDQQQEEEDSEKASKKLTPLERVQPNQVELKGIMWYPENPEGAMALVELPNGKGYVLKQDTKIGGNKGRVKNILPNKVIIEQEVTNILGKKETETVVLKLQNSSGENNE